MRSPHNVGGLRGDLCDPSAEDFVQHFDLSQVRVETIQNCRQGHRLICKRGDIQHRNRLGIVLE